MFSSKSSYLATTDMGLIVNYFLNVPVIQPSILDGPQHFYFKKKTL